MRRFIRLAEIPAKTLEGNHGGKGLIQFRRLLNEGDFGAPVDFVDFTIIPPGSTIGVHRHDGNEEIYFIASGTPRVAIDDEESRLERGSLGIVHSGQTHQLINDTEENVEILVVQVRTPEAFDRHL